MAGRPYVKRQKNDATDAEATRASRSSAPSLRPPTSISSMHSARGCASTVMSQARMLFIFFGAQAVVAVVDPLTVRYRSQIVDLAMKN